ERASEPRMVLMGPEFRAFRSFATTVSGNIRRLRFDLAATAFFAFAAIASSTNMSWADEDGVSFWIPGFFGSLAATPQQPGWSLINIYYHTSVSAGADVARAREITIGKIPANLSANLSANLNATGDLGIVMPN